MGLRQRREGGSQILHPGVHRAKPSEPGHRMLVLVVWGDAAFAVPLTKRPCCYVAVCVNNSLAIFGSCFI